MVSEKPPRRTKQKDEPLTIDIEAEKATAEASAPPADSPAPATPDVAAADKNDIPADANPLPEHGMHEQERDPLSAMSEPEPPVEPATPGEPPARAEDESDAATAANAASTEETWPRAAAERPIQAKSSSGSGLVAAGILGGLIALAGAGALQYGGVLPALGPQPPTPAAVDISPLVARIDQLQARMAEQPAATATTDTSVLEQRIAALEDGSRTGPGSQETQALAEVEAQQTQATEAIAALRNEIAGLKQSLADARATSDARLASMQEKLDAPRQDLSMAKAIAISSLKTAIDRGGPFLGELDTLSGISPDDPVIATLRPFAPMGIPARSELIRRFPGVADAILSAINQPAESANWSERLMASAMSIVKVRPVGNIEGESPEAIVARMEEKLRNGDLRGAAIEWQSLPQPGKTISAEFAKNLEDRVTIETAVNAALANAVDEKS